MLWPILGILLAIGFGVQAVQDANKFQQKKYWVMLALYVVFGLGILAQGTYLVLGIVGVVVVGIAHQFVRKEDVNPLPSGSQSRPRTQTSQAAAQADVNNLLFNPQNSPQANQLMALMVPVADDPAQAVVGKWTIEDGKIGNIGVTVEIFPDKTCRFSNNATGTWEIKEGNKMLIAAQPFAAFSLTPHETMMNGGWMEIKGGQGIMSSVILKRVGAPVSTGAVQQIATLYGTADKPEALIFSDGTIKNIKGQVLGHVDPQGKVYAASSRYWGRVAGNGDFFQRAGKDGEMHMGCVSAKGEITTKDGTPWGRVVLARKVTTSYSLPILGGAAMILNLLAQLFGSPDKM